MIVSRPMLMLLALATAALAMVSAANSTDAAQPLEVVWSMGMQTALTAIVSSLLTSGIAMIQIGRWLGTHTEKLLTAEKTAEKAYHRLDEHIDAHARGDFKP